MTSSLPSFSLERAIVDKEMRNGMYSAASYVISNALVQMPFVFLATFVASVTAYFLVSGHGCSLMAAAVALARRRCHVESRSVVAATAATEPVDAWSTR